MKSVAFYDQTTGLLHPLTFTTSDDSLVAANTPAGHKAIDQPSAGNLDPLSQQVNVATGEVIPYQPPTPGANYVWDAPSSRWLLDAATVAANLAVAQARAGIAALESAQHRAVRELALGSTTALARLQAIDAAIAALRPPLAVPST